VQHAFQFLRGDRAHAARGVIFIVQAELLQGGAAAVLRTRAVRLRERQNLPGTS
jgi:hypothetical protein